ncbi:Blood vessel epicardial substance-B [Nymphon striatum]|nr:Blood vessel epicardial substance-B [Nymphon striatum]
MRIEDVVMSKINASSFSTVATSASPGNISGNSEERFCEAWKDTDDPLVQTANFCFAVAFLIPHNFQKSVLIMRTFICIGFLLMSMWSGVNICAPDILAWNMIFMISNFIHVLHYSYNHFPPRINPQLQDLYTKLFQTLKVEKKLFKELENRSKLVTINPGEHYALEGITPASQVLSILLKGRLRVTYENVHLHYISSNQFIDSPEWEAKNLDINGLFQVTITAVERCFYVCWSRKSLEHIFTIRPILNCIMSNLIVFSIASYGSECWVLKTSDKKKIDAFEIWCYRRLLRISWTERKTNEWVLDKIGNPESLRTKLSRRKMSFVGHIFRSNDIDKELLMGTVYGNGGRGRSKTRLSDNIKEIGGGRSFVALYEMAQDRDAWRATAVQFETTVR